MIEFTGLLDQLEAAIGNHVVRDLMVVKCESREFTFRGRCGSRFNWANGQFGAAAAISKGLHRVPSIDGLFLLSASRFSK